MHLRKEDKEYLEAGAPAPNRAQILGSFEHSDRVEGRREGRDLNQAKAIWTRPKSELKDEDYQAFYQPITHDSEDARAWAHNRVEGDIEYTSLLYLPKRAPSTCSSASPRGGVQLYVKRVFIMDKAAELLPPYLRSCAGWSTRPICRSMCRARCCRAIAPWRRSRLRWSSAHWTCWRKWRANKPEEYAEFWQSFGAVLKEGIMGEFQGQKTRIAKLLHFQLTVAADDIPRGDPGRPASRG